MAKTKGKSVQDVGRELQKVIRSGNVLLGSKETMKALNGGVEGAKIVIHASNCPWELKKEFQEKSKEDEQVIVYEYPASSLELGLVCGKPYSIASLCITDADESEQLRLLSSNMRAKAWTVGD